MIERIIVGLLISALVSGAGFRWRALSARGTAAALFVGTAVIAGASWVGGLLLGLFFGSSSALSRRTSARTEAGKGGRRDERQVLANGGVAALAALGAPWLGDVTVIVLIGGALGAATADTWATEIGSRSGRTPRMLLSRVVAPVGVSGGVTVPGTLASIAGALLLGAVAGCGAWVVASGTQALMVGVAVTAGGVSGSLVDSLLGEAVQERRWCPVCERLTETDVHRCGAATVHARGWRWVNNDVVNLACTAAGMAVAGIGMWLLT